jgi:hypothetical protein
MNIWTVLVSIASALVSGGVLAAVITQWFAREKTRAEAMKSAADARKSDAEAERAKAEATKILSEITPASRAVAKSSGKAPKGWLKAGASPADYEIGMDQDETFHGKPSCYLRSRSPPEGFGTVMQMFKADAYLGKRLMLTGMAKSQAVEEWAGFWMRVDKADEPSVSFDNMQDRPISGTTGWTKYQIVLDVPHDSAYIAFGLLLDGAGEVWMADVRFAVVSSNTPTTDLKINQPTDYPDGPVNLSFEE